jgi:hypothetical protein
MTKNSDIALKMSPFLTLQAPKIYVPFCYVCFGPYEQYAVRQWYNFCLGYGEKNVILLTDNVSSKSVFCMEWHITAIPNSAHGIKTFDRKWAWGYSI